MRELCNIHPARRTPASSAPLTSSTTLPHTSHRLSPETPAPRASHTNSLLTTVSPRQEQVASTQRTTARSRSYTTTLARAAMEKRSAWVCGRSTVNLAGAQVRRFEVAARSRRATRRFSEALCFGDPGVEYELHRWAEEVGPEARTRTQRRARKFSSAGVWFFILRSLQNRLKLNL